MDKVKFSGLIKDLLDKYEETDPETFLSSKLDLPSYKIKLIAERLKTSLNLAEIKEISNKKKELAIRQAPIEENKNAINIYCLDSLSGIEFELFLKWLFEELGYNVQLTKIVADSGVDLVVSDGKEKIAVQAKRYNRDIKVSNQTILKTHGGRDIYCYARSIVITTSYFTPQAIIDAKKLSVETWDRGYLAATIEMINEKIKKINEKPIFPMYSKSLLHSIRNLESMKIFYIEEKENGKVNLRRHGIHYPLLTFYEKSLNGVSKCVFRIKDKKPVSEKEGESIILR